MAGNHLASAGDMSSMIAGVDLAGRGGFTDRFSATD
jgi:hypothetical protein